MMNCCFVFCVLVATVFQVCSHFVPHFGMKNGRGWWQPDDSKVELCYASVVPHLQTVGLIAEVLSILLLLYRLCPCGDDLDCQDCCSFSRTQQLLYKLSITSVGAQGCGCALFFYFLFGAYPEMLRCCGLSAISFLFSSFALLAWEGEPEMILPRTTKTV